MRFDPTHFEPLSATPAAPRMTKPGLARPRLTPKPRLTPLSPLPDSPRLPWKEAPFTTDPASGARRLGAAPERAAPCRPVPASALAEAARSAEASSPQPMPLSARLGRAELRTLLAIDLEGGEVCVRREGERMRYERVDSCGDVQERYPGATVRALIAAGHLRLRRCAHGGNVYAVAGDPVGRAGYRSRPERSGSGTRRRDGKRHQA